MAKLNAKRQRFVEEYLIDLNGTQAAIRAGYSAKTANEQAAQLLANLSVQEEISKAMAERSKRTGVNQDRVVMELAKIAFAVPGDFIDDDGTIMEGATLDDLAAVQSIKRKRSYSNTGETIENEVKCYDKVKALELLGKHIGMWSNKLNVTVSKPVVISGEDDLSD